MQKIVLRDNQEECAQACLAYLNGPSQKPGIVMAPTASGKSFIISSVAQRYGKPVMVLQPSKELLEQNYEKLTLLGGKATIFSASAGMKKLSEFTYATLGSVKKLAKDIKAFGVEVILIDECHDGYSPDPGSMFMEFIKALNPKKAIGFTATPYRLKSYMEGSKINLLPRMRPAYFKEWIHVIQIQEMVEKGFWSKLYYEMHRFDESGLLMNSSGSDFSEESVKQAIAVQGINNNIYKRIKKLQAEGVPSILVFMDSLETAERMCEFVPNCTYVGSNLPTKERSERIRKFKSGEIQVMLNYGILTTGFDYPDLRAIILGRPTLSLSLYYQIIGRGTRICPETGKEHCLIIDYCNNVDRFGRVENLELLDIPGWGKGMFNKDVLLTNTTIGDFRVTKQELLGEQVGSPLKDKKLWFGMHSGKTYAEAGKKYLEFLLNESTFAFHKDAASRQLKIDIETLLEEEMNFSLAHV